MDKNKIISLYKKGKTGREIATELGVGKSTVLAIVKNAGISRSKLIREHILQARGNKCDVFDLNFNNYLDGLLISDGCIPKPIGVSLSCFYTQSSISKSWLENIADFMSNKSIYCKIDLEKRKKKRNACWVLTSKRYDKFFDFRTRWYPNGIKRVPFDIDISSTIMLKNWIYGDGTFSKGTLRFCTDSFLVEDIDFLIKKLNLIGDFKFKKIKFGLDKKGNQKYRISICKRDGLANFYKFIGSCDQEYFNYKWS